ncbi:MAG: hypothetical protein IPM97_15610 [Bdellovibrionaceae bacterium]|nr:hypothetical protein [Pseudobdellovibrionaceae bacterium]
MNNFLMSVFLFIGLLSKSAIAAEPNFKCEIFGGIDGSAEGSLTLSGENPAVQKYELKIAEGNKEVKTFTGDAYLNGLSAFTGLRMETQKAIMAALNSSRRPNLSTGDLVLYTNTQSLDNSTLNILLMPSGEIGYLQIGFLQVLCM